MTKFCNEIHISSNFKFGFTCKEADDTHIAFVKLQYPYLTTKYCEECRRSSKLKFGEMVWLISADVCDILKKRNPQVCHYCFTIALLDFVLLHIFV